MSRWAVEMAEALRGDGSSGTDGTWRFATVNTTTPLTIKAHDQVISKHLYKSASLSLQAGDEVLVYESGVAFYVIARWCQHEHIPLYQPGGFGILREQ